jgi:hypothetical protein
MKPKEIKKSILLLNKKSIANLTVAQMNQVNGGLATKPTAADTTTVIETAVGCPCTHFCQTDTQ